MRRYAGLILLMMIGMLAVACGSAAPPAATTAAVTLIPAPTMTVAPTEVPDKEATVTGTNVPRAAATPLATISSPDVLLVYQKSGCFTGIKDVLTVKNDGTLELVNRKGESHKGSVPADRLTPVKQMLAQPAFAQLDTLYQATGADLCVYSITTRQADGTSRSVTTMDAAPTPPLLMQVIKEVDAWWKLVQ
jgi:hypothetical protein